MPCLKPLTLCCLTTAIFSLACHKNNDSPKPVTPTGTMQVNLSYLNHNVPSSYFLELIISEPGGKVLLDTITNFNSTVKAALQTNATLVDLTIVDTTNRFQTITVYKSVNPSTWVNDFPLTYVAAGVYGSDNISSGLVHYTNVPNVGTGAPYLYFLFDNGSWPGAGLVNFDPVNHTLDYGYNRLPGAYNYLQIPQLNLYKLYHPTQDKDTVDLTHMDTALIVNIPSPASTTLSYVGTTFLGINDSTNRWEDVNFTAVYPSGGFPIGNLQYVKQPMQAYELYYFARNSVNDNVGFYNYGKAVPTTGTFIDGSQATVQSTQIDDLSVKFSGTSPSFWRTYWTTQDQTMFLTVYMSPDSSNVRPLTMLSGLKSRLLSTSKLSGLTCKYLHYENIPGFNYAGYFDYVSNPAKVNFHQLNSATFYQKNF